MLDVLDQQHRNNWLALQDGDEKIGFLRHGLALLLEIKWLKSI